MIKNIIFDVGNVLMKWDKDYITSTIFKDPYECKVSYDYCFNNPLWYEFDVAKITDEQIKDKMKANLDKKDHHIIDESVEKYCDILQVINETNDWGIKMKNKGYNIYLLTNFPSTFHRFYERLPIKKYVDGFVCSSDVHLVKPDIEIYKYLFNKFNLKPEECLFIDDNKKNTEAALVAGMGKVITFNGDLKQLEEFDN